MVREHLVITLFLTMLVGAGGNAGNQSAIFVIRGLATGQFLATRESLKEALTQQLKVGALLGAALALGGFLRVYATEESLMDAVAISVSLFCIVFSSVVAGTCLPFGMAFAGVDPAHAGTTVQVVMDVSGVAITCAVCRLLLAHYSGLDDAMRVVAELSTAAAATGPPI